ncbi:glycosyl hydrolase [Paraburkholderia phosphatilytica]|uniref:glycosyl hydrolase n=1 Tax=Paraburkholderia phosphatilytica TaxID=2282883 RepID=UPI000E50CF35|nr:glycosyl hydrolase [Paraburkholderia phosphatilytica]
MTFNKRTENSSPAIAALLNQNQLDPVALASAPATRRRFLAGLIAGAGSLALAACGGGGSSPSATTNASSSTAGSTTQSAQGSQPNESSSGTTIPPASAITDGNGVQWTLSNGVVMRAGVNTNCPLSATLVLYWNHTIYAEDANGNWQINQNNVWSSSSDPRGTAATAAAQTSSALFYGINGHMAWTSGIYKTMTAAQQVAILQDLGVTNYRADVADAGMAQTVANALNGAFKGSGISILPCINPMNWDQTSSESTSYAYGYQLAQSIAQVLKGLVSYIECGNELDANGVESTGAGNSPADYNPAYWPAFRGVLRGMIDGVKSVDSTIKCGINVGIPLDYTALQMLWNGQTPNGSATPDSGATPLQWDITMFHWYETSGDIVRAGSQGLTNVLQILQQSFNLPIWLTEWGYALTDSSAQQTSYVTSKLNEYYSLRDTYNLQSVMMYELIDMPGGDSYGLLEADGATQKPCYAAFKSFTAANAV